MISRQQMANSNDGDDDSDDSMVFVKGFISSPREILLQLLDNAFPTIQIPESLQVSKEDEETSVERIWYMANWLIGLSSRIPSRTARKNIAYVWLELVILSRIQHYLMSSSDDEDEEVVVNSLSEDDDEEFSPED